MHGHFWHDELVQLVAEIDGINEIAFQVGKHYNLHRFRKSINAPVTTLPLPDSRRASRHTGSLRIDDENFVCVCIFGARLDGFALIGKFSYKVNHAK